FVSRGKQACVGTTRIVSLVFGLFAYENYDAIQIATGQRLAVHESITKFDAGAAGPPARPVRDVLEPTLTPASHASVRTTHLTSDILVIAGLWAMEFRRRRMSGA